MTNTVHSKSWLQPHPLIQTQKGKHISSSALSKAFQVGYPIYLRLLKKRMKQGKNIFVCCSGSWNVHWGFEARECIWWAEAACSYHSGGHWWYFGLSNLSFYLTHLHGGMFESNYFIIIMNINIYFSCNTWQLPLLLHSMRWRSLTGSCKIICWQACQNSRKWWGLVFYC